MLSFLTMKIDVTQFSFVWHIQLQFIHRASSTNNFIRIKSKGADTDEEDEPHK